MEISREKLELNSLRKFWKKYENFILPTLTFLICFIPRIFFINLNKGIWWDGASFLIQSLKFIGINYCNVELHRLPGFSIILIPFAITKNLTLLRLYLIIISSLSSVTLFLFTKRFFGKFYAFLSSFLLSFSWLHLFYSLRILPHTFALLLVSLSYYFYFLQFDEKCKFANYLKNKFGKEIPIIISSVILGFYYCVRMEAIAYIIPILLFSLIFLMKKKITIKQILIQLLFIATPIAIYQIYQYFSYGSFLFQERLNYELTKDYGESFFWYFENINHILGDVHFPIALILLLSGIILNFIFSITDIKRLFLPISFLIIFFLSSLSPHHEDRYLIPIFSLAFPIIVSNFYYLERIIGNKKIVYVSSVIIAISICIISLSYGYPILISKANTYKAVVDAALWYSNQDKPIITVVMEENGNAALPQLCYFAGKKEYIKYGKNLSETLTIAKEKNAFIYYAFPYDGDISFLSLKNFFENTNQGIIFNQTKYEKFLKDNNLSIVKIFNDGLGTVIIYEVR